MKTPFLLLTLILLSSFNSNAQEDEYFVYCISNMSDTLVISKISETQVGDTVIREYVDPLYNSNFKYYIFNDTIFSKYQNEYVMIGANQAQIGDIWNPIWYSYLAYDYSSFEDQPEYCPLKRKLKVVSIDTIQINGINHKKYSLSIMDEFPLHPSPWYIEHILFSFIEGIGATDGGPFYNLNNDARCDYLTDMPTITFRSLSTNGGYYLEEDCNGNLEVDAIEKSKLPTVFNNNGILMISNIQNYSDVKIMDTCGKVVVSSKNDHINVNHLKGLYFLIIQNKQGDIYQTRISF